MSSDDLTSLGGASNHDRIINELGTFIPWKYSDPKYRRKRMKPSVFWSLGARYSKQEEPEYIKAWLCFECKTLVQLWNESPSNAQKYMEKKHGWREDTTSLAESDSIRNSSSARASIAPSSSSQPTLINMFQGIEPSGSLWRTNSLRWLIETHQPFSTVDHPAFRRMITGITPKMNKYMYGRNAARSWTEDEFVAAKNKIKLLLKQSLSKINISMDIWTSDYSTYALLGVNAHFIVRVGNGDDSQLQAKSVLLALRRLRERHTGTYEASILAEVVREYNFVDELGVCVTDNAGDNNTAVRSLFNNLAPEVQDLTGKRVRCLAHIVNLAAKAFLYKTEVEAFETE